MLLPKNSFQLIVFPCIYHLGLVLAHYNTNACCRVALEEKAFLQNTTQHYICGQVYDPRIPPAPALLISYAYCSTRCSGFGLSKGSVPNEWAALIVVFLLPTVIFSTTIPRQQKIDAGMRLGKSIGADRIHPGLWVVARPVIWVLMSIFIVIPRTVIDTMVWISTIIVAAGPMMIGGLYEARLDWKIIIHVRVEDSSPIHLNYAQKVELLTAIVCGNLMRGIGDPQGQISENLSIAKDRSRHDEVTRTRLLSMMSSQCSFGSVVGAPVIFYLCSFVYLILDLENQKSSTDLAFSLAFSADWMIMVHVAIVSGCLLASNNPSTSSAIVGSHLEKEESKRALPGFSPVYETAYQPVWLWGRGCNKMDWIKNSKAWRHEEFQRSVKMSKLDWFPFIFSPVMVLIVIPPFTGGFVAYTTPPVGLGCRSLCFLCYAGFQVVLTLIATVNAATKDSDFWVSYPKTGKACRGMIRFIFWAALVGSFFTAIGGTMMQIMGVFRNCLCHINIRDWLHPRSSPGICVSSDTQTQRRSSRYWVLMGTTATVFMTFVGYAAWWYQRQLRKVFIAQVEALQSERDDEPVTNTVTHPDGSSNNSTMVSCLKLGEDTNSIGFSGLNLRLSKDDESPSSAMKPSNIENV